MEQLGQFITHHWQLWGALIVVLILILINEFISQRKKATELSPQSAVNLINHDHAVVIDLRDAESYKNGHIIDSINAKPEDFDLQKMNKYKTKPIILVCAKGLQSPTTAAKIRDQGYQPIVLGGGMAAWLEANLPLVKGKS